MVFNRLKMAVAKGFLGSASAFIIMSSAINVANAKATAQSNHAFIGAQVGTSILTQKRVSSMSPASYNRSYSYTAAAYGILGGYEMWFMDNLAGRFYASFGGANYYMIGFGAGADVVWNFMNVGGGNLGIFGGLYIGANYWLSGWYSNWSNANSAMSFDMALDLGVRWALDKHVVEVLGKIPFIEAKTASRTWSDGDVWSYYSKESFSLMARYMYRF